ncbi:hypothetical protein [Sphingomonas sp.]|nr:hypothetical protein [Sphingomonas sp.]
MSDVNHERPILRERSRGKPDQPYFTWVERLGEAIGLTPCAGRG